MSGVVWKVGAEVYHGVEGFRGGSGVCAFRWPSGL